MVAMSFCAYRLTAHVAEFTRPSAAAATLRALSSEDWSVERCEKYSGNKNYYDKKNPLTPGNKFGPPIT
jgi:hypothetical protein